MKYFTRINILLLTFFLLFSSFSLPQSRTDLSKFKDQNLILSLQTGFSYGFTDYKTSNIEPLIRGSLEYYPLEFNFIRVGLKVFGGGSRISQTDSRGLFSNNDLPNPRLMPTETYTDIINAGASLNLAFAATESVIPYFGIGGAYLNFSPKNSNGTILDFNSKNKYKKDVFSFVIEAGVDYQLSDRFNLTAGLSYYPTSTDYLDDISAGKKNDAFLSALIGVSYAFIGRTDSDNDGVDDRYDLCPDTPAGVVVDEFGCPIDSDKDGVPDYLDKCPDTPVGVEVDKNGCPKDSDQDGVPDYLDKCPNTPLGVAVDANGCPPDEDGDGIPDYLDKCPNTPPGVKVDRNGCPIDSDKDGVPDYLDKCPNTPPGVKVNSEGCSEAQINQDMFYQFILRGDDTFEPNSATLLNSAKLLLNEIAFYIQNQPGTKWRIEGHMDSQGTITMIKKLSYDRAKAVYDYLVSQGVSADKLSIYGLGDSFPIGNNNTAEGRSSNRRIMIVRED